MLAALKPKVGHGNWQEYCKKHFAHLGAVRTLQVYMKPDLATDELKAICDQTGAVGKSADSALLKNGQITVVNPSERAKDDDPNPAPRTNTHHTEATRKKREDEKPRTAAIPVAAEIVEPDDEDEADRREAALGQLAEIVEILGMTTVLKIAVNVECDDSDKKERAALLRKVADALDPAGSTVSAPVKAKAERTGATPTAEQLVKLIPGTWPKVLQAAAQDWCEHKQSLPRRDRIQSTKAWLAAVKLMGEQPADRVASKINKAIANNWKGWDHNDGNNNKASDQLYRNPGPRAPVKYDNVPG
jgi:hypothetical protein